MSGTATDFSDGTANSLTGTVDSSGHATVTITNASGNHTNQGVFTNHNGQLTATFANGGDGSTVVTVNKAGNQLQYAGTYTGHFSADNGDSGTINVTISTSGSLSGSVNSVVNGKLNLSGSVSPAGVTSTTVSTAGLSNTSNGGSAFNASGQLVVYLVDSTNGVAIVTLSKSTT